MIGLTIIILFLCSLCLAGTLNYGFDSDALGEWTENGEAGMWQIKDGELIGEFQGVPSSDLAIGSEEWDDYVLECKVKLVDTFAGGMTWVGIFVRYQDTGNTCVFALDLAKQRANIDLEVAGASKVWLNFPLAIEKNEFYKLKVSAEGNHFQFFIDDEFIHEFEDDTLLAGKAGVLIIRAKAHFDDFIITGNEIGGVFALTERSGNLVTTWGQVKNLPPI